VALLGLAPFAQVPVSHAQDTQHALLILLAPGLLKDQQRLIEHIDRAAVFTAIHIGRAQLGLHHPQADLIARRPQPPDGAGVGVGRLIQVAKLQPDIPQQRQHVAQSPRLIAQPQRILRANGVGHRVLQVAGLQAQPGQRLKRLQPDLRVGQPLGHRQRLAVGLNRPRRQAGLLPGLADSHQQAKQLPVVACRARGIAGPQQPLQCDAALCLRLADGLACRRFAGRLSKDGRLRLGAQHRLRPHL